MSQRMFLAILIVASASITHAAERKLLQPEDIFEYKNVEQPEISVDGKHIVYVLKTMDKKEDKNRSNLWMVNWDGSENRALTFGDKGGTVPHFSADGKWLAFLSSRDDENELTQLWLLPVGGGEAEKLTNLKGGVDEYAWSPDSNTIVIVGKDPEAKPTLPIVIDRYRFKKDGESYLTQRYSHLYLVDLQSHKTEQLTKGNHDEIKPTFSPNGKQIVFVTKRGIDPDRTENWNVYLIDAKIGSQERQLTKSKEADCHPDWDSPPVFSPDGKWIAYLHGGDPAKIEYATHKLAIISTDGTKNKILTEKLDRNIYSPHWSADGKSMFVIVEDDGKEKLVRIDVSDTQIKSLVDGEFSAVDYDLGVGDKLVVRLSASARPEEIYAVENGFLRQVTAQNAGFASKFKLAKMQKAKFNSEDGTRVHGFIMTPPDGVRADRKALLLLHGGPQLQYEDEFDIDLQIYAAAGYTLILPNPRGSSGRGTAYSMGIYRDWGHKDVEDDLAAVNDAIAKGLASPQRLGVGGWSYGGMSTNYLIASTHRFKAAVSGASISNIFAGFGTDQYAYDYETELGAPWKNTDTWMKISYPFFHADHIKTPTLFMCGDADSNVPLLNSEQMYEALRSLNVPTQLIVYPGQYHGISKPSFQLDKIKRYLGWYGKWIK